MAFAGFDSLSYPGDLAMAWLKSNTNLSFVGFYLAPAPSRQTSDWMGRRGTLANQGWGFAPIYVGQQAIGAPGQHNEDAGQGQVDATDACQLMQGEGFPQNSVVYLDIEMGGGPSAGTLSYVTSWLNAVSTSGLYLPGIYCSYTTAPNLMAACPAARVWAYRLLGPAPGPAWPPNFPTNDPASCGVVEATAWQYAQNVKVNFTGAPIKSLRMDLDCATVSDPSQ